MKVIGKWTGALLLLAAATAGRAAEHMTLKEQWSTGIVCEDYHLASYKETVRCDDGIEKAMRAAATQLPPLPKGIVIEALIEGHEPSDGAMDLDPFDYSVMVIVDDNSGAHSRSVGYATKLHCTQTHEDACGRSIIYRGYLTWEMDNYVAEGSLKKRP